MFKGAIHIHSTYSDGEFTLAQLRRVFETAGCNFLCMTDHAEDFDEEKLRAYIDECAAVSDDRFCVIAGLEYQCRQRMHVLGLGVTKLVRSQEPVEVIQHIASHGGVSVIAHPKTEFFSWIETFRHLPNGIETWNAKYDGRYAPRTGTLELLARLRERNANIHAFYGIDLHWRHQFRRLFNTVQCQALLRQEILRALGEGSFHGILDGLELPSSGRFPANVISVFETAHARSDRLRRSAKTLKMLLNTCGLKVPRSVKAQLRRIF